MKENKKLYDLKYQKLNLKQYKFFCHKEKDKDIIDHLEKQGNKQGYLKELIRADIKKD